MLLSQRVCSCSARACLRSAPGGGTRSTRLPSLRISRDSYKPGAMHAGLSFLCAVAWPAYFSLSIFAARMKSLSVSLYPGDALLLSNSPALFTKASMLHRQRSITIQFQLVFPGVVFCNFLTARHGIGSMKLLRQNLASKNALSLREEFQVGAEPCSIWSPVWNRLRCMG